MMILRNKRTKKIYAGDDLRFYPPIRRYVDGDYLYPMIFLEDDIEVERKQRELPENKFEAVPVALVDLRTGEKILWNQKEDTKT